MPPASRPNWTRARFFPIACRASAAGLWRRWRWAPGLGFVPEYRSKAYIEKQQDAQASRKSENTLSKSRTRLWNIARRLGKTRKAMEKREELGLRMDKGVLTRNDALKDLANVADKLKQQLQDLGKKNPSFKALEHEARDPNNPAAPPAAPPIRSKWTTCKSPGQSGENPAALDKLAEQMQQLQKAAAGMPKDDSPAAAAERQKWRKACPIWPSRRANWASRCPTSMMPSPRCRTARR
jgi:hypothetical protein